MTIKSDLALLSEVASIFSQQAIADKINHPREVINRWLKERQKQPTQDWLTFAERVALEEMLPSAPAPQNFDFTFIDLFAGIGGLRRGFESAGGKCIFTSEWDKYAQKTYKANYGAVNLSNEEDLNPLSVVYAKFWTQLALLHSANARPRSIL